MFQLQRPCYFVLFHCVFASQVLASDDLLSIMSTLQQAMNPDDGNFAKLLVQFIDMQDLRLDKIKQYIDMFESLQHLTSESGSVDLNNPINILMLLKKLTVNTKDLEMLITKSQLEVGKLGNLIKEMNGLIPPSEDELNSAALAIVRLQDVYNLSMHDIVSGQLGIVTTGVKLAANDCWRLGQQSLLNLNLDLALGWFEQGLILTTKDDNSTQQINAQLENIRLLKALLQKSMDYVTPEVMKSISTIPGLPTELLHHVLGKSYDSDPNGNFQQIYKRLCRGENTMGSFVAPQLDCMYVPHDITGNLQRVKVEYLMFQPLVALLHDIVYDSEIERIKAMASTKLEPVKIHKLDNPSDIRTSPIRTASATWLPKPNIQQLYRRIEDYTGLSTADAEDLHVVKYGLGGHYEVHTDFFDFHSKGVDSPHGDRIATALLYLTDGVVGGATVFPHLHLSVKPQKGSALFWFNLLRNGRGDFRTIHAACPVFTGEKWVANAWILDKNQAFRRPCGIQEHE